MGIFDGSWYNPAGFIGNAGDLKKFAGSKTGSLFSGRAILQGGPKEQDMETARTFDVFGSPATAGTKQQSTARLAAILYGAFMGLGALGAGAAGSSTGTAAGEAGATGATAGGAGGLGGLGGTGSGAPAGGALGGGTSGGMASAPGYGSNALRYANWARRGYGAYNMLNNGFGGPQQAQGGAPYGGAASAYPQRPMYGRGVPTQRPMPGSGPFDWLKF